MTDSTVDLETKPKRQVSYNQDAVLCPHCKKRIRLNNDGKMRVHVVGKMGSDKCVGDEEGLADTSIQTLADEAEKGYDPAQLVSRSNIFSDQG